MSVQDAEFVDPNGGDAVVKTTDDDQKETPDDINEIKNLISVLQKRVNDQSKIIANLKKQPPKEEVAAEPLKGASALQALEKKAIEREERAMRKAINTSVLSALVENGFSEDSARKLIPAMLSEGNFDINDLDEVEADDGSGARPVKDFVQILLKRDDWRALIPPKKAPEKPSHGRPVIGPKHVTTNENGVWSAAAIRAAHS